MNISVKETPALAVEYIDKWKDIAINEMKRTGVPASITLAQGMIESGLGHSRLAVEGNNHFGIKCHNDWTGPTIRHHDDRRNECFRKYRSAEESFRDHSDFLKTTSRYTFLFELDPVDY
ncbi:MAG: glycoside hydrolase family 73 protein, partial [Bacteroidales bacterium]